MFGMFERLHAAAAHADPYRLVTEWDALMRTPVSSRWDGRALTGHIPIRDFTVACKELHAVMEQRGLYVWGAWHGDAARIQYVGITASRFRKRFRSRYVAYDRSNPGLNWSELEISLANAHSAALEQLEDDWAPLAHGTSVEKYAQVGIPLPRDRRRNSRLPRAERYAKIGLDNLWFYVIPATTATPREALLRVEALLVAATNAALFTQFAHGDISSIPLLNKSEVSIENRLVPSDQRSAFAEWLAGCWWGNGRTTLRRAR